MWYIVKTDVFTEQKSIDLLGEKFKDTIVDFYFPMGRRTYKNELGEKKVRFTPVLQGLFFIRVQSENVWRAFFPNMATSCIRVLIIVREVPRW